MSALTIETLTDASRKLAYHSEIVNGLLERKRRIPLSMEVDLSYACGDGCLGCHMAFTHVGRIKSNGNYDTSAVMTPEIAKTVLSKLAQAGVKSVVFSGGENP